MLAGSPLASAPLAWTASDVAPPAFVPSTLRQAVLARLKGLAALRDLIGDRIVSAYVPGQTARPCVTFTIPANPHGHTFDGSDGTASARVQINVWANDLVVADQATEAVRLGIHGFRGWIGSVEILGVFHVDSVDLSELAAPGGDSRIFRIMSDYQINHRVAIPNMTEN